MRNNKESFFDYCKRNNRIDLLDEWNYDKNNGLNPTDVSSGNGKKIWWICKDGHEWDSRIIDRKRNKNCPYCSNKKVLEGYNDLATTHPEIAKEWHSTKNGNLKPTQVVAGSNKKVWWKCSKGHEWDISPNVRTGRGRKWCRCGKQIAGMGDND